MDTTPATQKNKKIWIIVIIAIVVLGCLCIVLAAGGGAAYLLLRGKNGSGETILSPLAENPSSPSDDQPVPSVPQSKPTDKPVFELPEILGPKLGDEIRAEYCGFSFKQIPEYDYTEFGCFLSMLEPGATDSGPAITIFGGKTNEEMTEDDVIAKLKETESEDNAFLNQTKVKIDGKSGYSFEIEQTMDGVAVKGRVVSVLVNPNQLFTIIGVAPVDKWEDLNTYFNAIIKSVKFFDPVPQPTETPSP